MNGTAYTPRAGSVAMRAIHHLEQLPAGAEMTSAALAEAIGVESNLLGPNLHHAELNGAIRKRKKFADHPRAPLFWSLPKVTADTPLVIPTMKTAAAKQADASPRRSVEPQTAARLCDGGQGTVADIAKDSAERARAEPRIGSVAAQPMRIALWSDGTLQIERSAVGGAAELVLFCRAEAAALVAYLDSISLETLREETAA